MKIKAYVVVDRDGEPTSHPRLRRHDAEIEMDTQRHVRPRLGPYRIVVLEGDSGTKEAA